jgi:hypothetical protein
MRTFPAILAALSIGLLAACGASSSPDEVPSPLTKASLAGLSGVRFETEETVTARCMDGMEYEVKRMAVHFDASGNPCVRRGCGDSISCYAAETAGEILDAIGRDCVLSTDRSEIRCSDVRLIAVP